MISSLHVKANNGDYCVVMLPSVKLIAITKVLIERNALFQSYFDYKITYEVL